jgi:hypothetical protein
MHKLRSLVATGLLAALAAGSGCGGGLVIGIGPDDDPPSVSIAASATAAPPGGSVSLNAQASDDDYVLEVVFYRLDAGGGTTRLCIDTVASYDCSGPIPANAQRGSTVGFFARAYDSVGQARDSTVLSINVE